ncbi:hypothetical protein ANRL1_00165 [Anaerolineae bacterium]|nr:hypothetical protein ANRL1_00165 [Anaerolineae bacterium]
MAYKSVKFLAQEWREREDPATAELIIEASFPSLRKRCLVLAEPVPGTDPVVVKYSCLSVSCTGDNQCVLKKREDPDGSIVYYCDCDPLEAASVSAAGAKKSRKKAN